MFFGKIFICLTIGLCLFASPAPAQPKQGYKYLYNLAEKLSNTRDHTDKTDDQALKSYLSVIQILTSSKRDDLFLLKTYISTGTFLQVLGKQRESITYFKNAIILKRQLPQLADSVLFRPLVYCGNAYYSIDAPDTAESYYKKAGLIAEKFPGVSELGRLYNTLGVISYSTGNYSKSITYYEKAISTRSKHTLYDNFVYKNNLAAALKKLKRYTEALNIYLALLPLKVETDKLLHNIGSAYLAMGNNQQAIYYLQKVHYIDQKKLNDLGLAWLREKKYEKADSCLQQSVELSLKLNKSQKNSDYGITLKYLGDEWLERKQVRKAIGFYQQSINNLLQDFRSNDVYTNPSNFNSAFNAIELLETLTAKAIGFKELYKETGKVRDLEASLQTYLSFYTLANHIERFYETDESRLLISNRKYFSRQQPIDICLQLFHKTGNKKFIETAFSLDEDNKANTLSLYLEESKIKIKARVPANLLKDEGDLKGNITRFSLKAATEHDTANLAKLKLLINDYTIKLLGVQEKINQKTGFNASGHPTGNNKVTDLQKTITSGSAVLSYNVNASRLIGFVITANDFEFFTEKLDPDFFSSIKEMYNTAQYREGNNIKQIRSLGQSLYSKLIMPAVGIIKNKKELMIIPDGELNFLPFELLTGPDEKNLLSNFSISYNYSCSILLNSQGSFSTENMNRLGIAPFDREVKDGANPVTGFAILPASQKEVISVGGTSLLDKNATKQAFLKRAHNFNIIHLATHAYANDLHPEQSYIAFYPAEPDSAINYKLYLPEIYNLRLDKTRLVVLSACESGAGELVNGEGLMSLSRAFSYSGCDNIVTSMWNADDESTAYISGKLYFYLQKGYTIADALRKSKLDYLDDPAISSSKKLAGYWAHLRLTGNFERPPNNYWWRWYVLALMVISVVFMAIKKGRLNKSRRPRTI